MTETTTTPWMTRRDVATHFKVHVNTVDRWRRAGLPAHAEGGVLRFDRTEVDQWLRAGVERAEALARGEI